MAGYEEFAPLIARMAAGEPDLLVPGLPCAFEETGGSSAGAKLIPYTPALLAAFRRALLPWLDDLAATWPAIATGRAWWSISPAARAPRQTAAGLPIGLGGDAAYFGAELAPHVLATLAVPPEVGALAEVAQWRAATARHLEQCADLALVSVWSPTFLLEFADHLRVPPVLISCWDQAASRPWAEAVRARFPQSVVQGKGLLATEAVVSIPLSGWDWPVLAPDAGYFEFVDDDGTACEASDTRVGAEYGLLLTTAGGLYRYAIGDRVRVRGFAGEAPLLEFIGRDHTVDLCGEKLGEAFVLAALAPLGLRFALLAPRADGARAYSLHVDAAEVAPEACAALAAAAERCLAANPQYAYARRLGQLAPLDVVRVAGALEAWLRRGTARGQRLGDIKPPVLLAEPFVSAGAWAGRL